MNYIVLDLEWNQNPDGKALSGKGLTFEIIEIGAVKMNENREITDTYQQYISPKVYSQLHYMTREVTGLGIRELRKKGKGFEKAVREFFEWCGDDCKFCTWGPADLDELQNNLDYFHIGNLLSKPLFYLDIQKMFSLQHEDGKSRSSLKAAVVYLNIRQNEAFHGAAADAMYTALVLRKLDFDTYGAFYSVDYHQLPQNPKEELFLDFGTYTKYISREFANKEEALEEKRVTALCCTSCRKALRKKIKWFSCNGRIFYAVAFCPEHGWLKGKIRIKKGHNGGIFVVKTQKMITEEKMQEIRNKKNEIRIKRIEKQHRQEEIAKIENKNQKKKTDEE